MMIKFKIFTSAVFMRMPFFRVRYQDHGISKLLTLKEAFDIVLITPGVGRMFIDYEYAKRFFI